MSISFWRKRRVRWSFVLVLAFGTATLLSGSVFADKGGGRGSAHGGAGGHAGRHHGGGHIGRGHAGHGHGGGGHQHHRHGSSGVHFGISPSFGYGGFGYSSGYGARGYSFGYPPARVRGYGGYGSYYGTYPRQYATPSYGSFYSAPRYLYVQPSTATYNLAPGTLYASPPAQPSIPVAEPGSELRPGMVLPDGAVVVSVGPISENTPSTTEQPQTEEPQKP